MQSDVYYDGLISICAAYCKNKEVVRGMLGTFKSVETVLCSMYVYLAGRGEIDPIDSEDSLMRARYLLEIL